MFFSKTCEYAIKTMIYLKAEHREGKRLGLKDISSHINSPEPFTAKILQQLVRHDLIDSVRGPHGGFSIKDPNAQLSLLHIVTAIDGDGIIRKCVLGLDECSAEHPCAVHDEFVVVRDHLASILANTSVKTVADGVKNQQKVLTR